MKTNSYFGELLTGWRALLSAVLGLSCGLMIFGYTAGIMGPALVAEFGWSQSNLALLTGFSISGVFAAPILGRLADTHGARLVATIGVGASPIIYLALSQMQNFATYAAIMFIQAIVLFATTPMVYCRVVVQYFNKARGLALAIAAAGPSALAAIGGPLLNNFVQDHGWRNGYLAVSLFTLVFGIAAVVLMPPPKEKQARAFQTTAKADFMSIFRNKYFWLLFVSMWLVNIPSMPLLTQMSLILKELGITGKDASLLISAYASGTLVGRFISGVALDRFPAPVVAAGALGLSACGLFILAMHDAAAVLAWPAILLVGLAYGAETDILGYLVYSLFGMRLYSSVFALVGAATTIAAASGGVILSLLLGLTGFYWPFLFASSILVAIGSLLLLLLPRRAVTFDEVSSMPDGGPLAPITAAETARSRTGPPSRGARAVITDPGTAPDRPGSHLGRRMASSRKSAMRAAIPSRTSNPSPILPASGRWPKPL
ncbi:Sugar phosphate permease [Novosphingobium sp. CF614]|uniref:MFS transporter n=1 Tax=Novosphingobium sp. CF614 TaxID=1884364 RepID=UPI0008F059FD|nr:MFS transporter [Novosphingobium sp. CF614]SFG01217.1 Sugar phosphate permease [Novosphingobium sp. CF614]